MTVRLEICDCMYQVTRYTDGKLTGGPHRYEAEQLDSAMGLARMWSDREMTAAMNERFVSQADREAVRVFKQLTERSPFNGGSSKKS